MKTKRILRTLIILAILTTNIGCDQISKKIVRQSIYYGEQFYFANNHLLLTKIENTGAFLSAGESLPQPVKIILLMILPIVALGAGLIYVITKRKLSNLTIVGICFVIGGGVGNIYDRLIYGSVTDFLHIDFGLFRTGVFNMADVSVMVGAGAIVWDSFSKREKNVSHEDTKAPG